MEVELEEPPHKYLKYDKINREIAVQDVKNGSISINQASKKYNVPSSTIHDYVRGKHSKNPMKRGSRTILKTEEEQKIADWLIQCSEMGDPRNENDLKVAAARMRKARLDDDTPAFKNAFPSPFWLKTFEKRNRQISIRKPETVTRAAANITEGYIRNFFEHIFCYLSENNLLDILDRPEAMDSKKQKDEETAKVEPRKLRGRPRKNLKT